MSRLNTQELIELTLLHALGLLDEQDRLDYEAARARNESAKADLNELDLAIKRGEYVPRAEVQAATATALSALSQTLRSVPDNLERTLGLSPDIAQEVGRQIDAALDDMATRFEELTVQAVEVENGSDLV